MINPILAALGLMFMRGSGGGKGARKRRRGHWPRVHDHPPVVMPPMSPMHVSPADHAASEHAVTHHAQSPADHAASEHAPEPAHPDAAPADHAAQEITESVMHAIPGRRVPVHRVVVKPAPRKRRRAVRPAVFAPAQPAPQIPGVTSVASVQRILVGLGWTGALTTKGAVRPELQDGLFGPITVADWNQSANKRGLDPIIERISGTIVRVDPVTLASLTQVAKSKGAVVGLYIP